MPYILGASPQYAEMYARVFGRTTKLLPNFGNHLATDAMHILIDVFVIAVIGGNERRHDTSVTASTSIERPLRVAG